MPEMARFVEGGRLDTDALAWVFCNIASTLKTEESLSKRGIKTMKLTIPRQRLLRRREAAEGGERW
jgi:hypothetical protein